MKRALAILLLLSATACDPYYARHDRDDYRRRDERERRDRDDRQPSDGRRNTEPPRTPDSYR